MATAERLETDFLTCAICYDIYKCPKSLPCLHTFCLSCLASYIKAEDDSFGVRRKGYFPCPMCRVSVKPKDGGSKPLYGWAEDFPTNFFIEGLISTFMKEGSEQTTASFPRKQPQGQPPSQQKDSATVSSLRNYNAPFAALPQVGADYIFLGHSITSLPRLKSTKTYTLVKTLYGTRKIAEAKFNAVCVLDGNIVALDFQNQLVQLFFNWETKLDVNVMTLQLDLPAKPDSMVAINKSMFFVSLPSRKELCLISIVGLDDFQGFPTKLEMVSCIKTLKSYKCLGKLSEGKLLAVALEPDPEEMNRKLALDVLDYAGSYIYSIRYGSDLKSITPINISVDGAGLIYILDYENNIYCLSQDGREVFRYEPQDTEDQFQRLQSLDCGQGNIYLTDVDAYRVFKLSNDCGFPTSCEILLSKDKGVCKPMDVNHGLDGTLYVACWDGCVRVYATDPRPSILKNQFKETNV